MAVGLLAIEQVALACPGEHALACLVLREPGERAGINAHLSVDADHGQLGQAVLSADLEVGRVVSRRDLERAGAELGVDLLVLDHGHATLDERDDHLLPNASR